VRRAYLSTTYRGLLPARSHVAKLCDCLAEAGAEVYKLNLGLGGGPVGRRAAERRFQIDETKEGL
jgi:hypothetical protein